MNIADLFKKVPELEADEHTHQVALFLWAASNFENDQSLRLLHAIPNGGERNPIVASRMKAEGVRKGVPDVCLPVPKWDAEKRLVCAGLYIEMKRPSARLKREPKHKWDTGGVSEDQIFYLNALTDMGYKCVVCYHWYEAANEIKFYLTGTGLDNVE